MLFFRSEEHLKNWAQYNPELDSGIVGLNDLMKMFSAKLYSERLSDSFVSHINEYLIEVAMLIPSLESFGSFWDLSEVELPEKSK